MSVENEILRIQNNIAAAYAAVADKGGEVPLHPTSANLAAAVASIPAGITQEQLDAALSEKQDKLTGTAGQISGFNASGGATAVNPNGYIFRLVTQSQYDALTPSSNVLYLIPEEET